MKESTSSRGVDFTLSLAWLVVFASSTLVFLVLIIKPVPAALSYLLTYPISSLGGFLDLSTGVSSYLDIAGQLPVGLLRLSSAGIQFASTRVMVFGSFCFMYKLS